MSQTHESDEHSLEKIPFAMLESEPPRPRIRLVPLLLGILAWGVIVALVVFSVVQRHFMEESPREVTAQDQLNLYMVRTQARYVLGTREFFAGHAAANDRQLYVQAKALDTGPVDQRIRFLILAGELEGPQEALAQIAKLEQRLQANHRSPTPAEQSQLQTLRKLYTDYARLRYDAPSVRAAERDLLRQQLGWFGDLALSPAGRPGTRDGITAVTGLPAASGVRDGCPDPEARRAVLQPARRVLVIFVAVFISALGLGLLGLLMLGGLLLLMGVGVVQGGLDVGKSPAGVYAETFALWIVLFGGLSLGVAKLPLGEWHLLGSGLGTLVSLMALLWPRLRGIPFRQLREDIGWTLGRQPALEPAAGVAAYVMAIPLLLLGLLVVVVLTLLQNLGSGGAQGPDDFASPHTAAHPVLLQLVRGGWAMRLQIFFVASIVAPLVEETMFRGVLYRHLRELTHGWNRVASVLVAAVISSFIFAIIHPQGVLAVPALMALACGFALAREWRLTLIPAMVAHGLNNGLVLLLSIGMFGG